MNPVRSRVSAGPHAGGVSPDGLLPLQIEIAERLIAQFASSFSIALRPATGIHYMFDLSDEHPPGRLPASPALTPGVRCFGPGEASAQADEIAQFIDHNQVLPLEPSLGGAYDPTLVLTTLRHLLRYWAPKLPERKARRRRHLERVTIVHE